VGAYSAPSEPLAGFGGPTSKGTGKEREEEGKGEAEEGKGRKERGREWKGEGRGGKARKGKGLKPPQSKFSGYVAGHNAT